MEAVLKSSPKVRLIEDGDVEGENLYSAMGQTKSGRYLIVFFILKRQGGALVVSSREMSRKERRIYEKK